MLTTYNEKARLSGLLFFFLVLCSCLVFAGGSEDFFVDGIGVFSDEIDTVEFTVSVESVSSSGELIPAVVSDIDGDGVDDVVVADDTNIRVYTPSVENQNFVVVDAYSVGESLEAPFYVRDGYSEIYFITASNFHVLYFNGSGFEHYNLSRTDRRIVLFTKRPIRPSPSGRDDRNGHSHLDVGPGYFCYCLYLESASSVKGIDAMPLWGTPKDESGQEPNPVEQLRPQDGQRGWSAIEK